MRGVFSQSMGSRERVVGLVEHAAELLALEEGADLRQRARDLGVASELESSARQNAIALASSGPWRRSPWPLLRRSSVSRRSSAASASGLWPACQGASARRAAPELGLVGGRVQPSCSSAEATTLTTAWLITGASISGATSEGSAAPAAELCPGSGSGMSPGSEGMGSLAGRRPLAAPAPPSSAEARFESGFGAPISRASRRQSCERQRR